jgi:hypothetical protein
MSWAQERYDALVTIAQARVARGEPAGLAFKVDRVTGLKPVANVWVENDRLFVKCDGWSQALEVDRVGDRDELEQHSSVAARAQTRFAKP